MKLRQIKEGVFLGGAVDWDRRLFDALIPLPDGTSYNAYLIISDTKTVLIDSVDPAMKHILMEQLETIPNLDYIISQHCEQDHSGTIPDVLEKYKNAKVITNPKCKDMLIDHLHIAEDRFITVKDGETFSLGNKTLKFIYTPWVHWPETMCTYLEEDNILFTCDFFGSHLATTDLYSEDEQRVYEAGKRYFAEIMMPFRPAIMKNIEKLKDLKIDVIGPSHGPVHNNPAFIIDAYSEWVWGAPKNHVMLPFISMHGSTNVMVKHLIGALTEKGVHVEEFDLTTADLGKLAMTLVDTATVVIGSPTVLTGPHPQVVNVTYLVNALRPKLKFLSIIGSYGWGSQTIKHLTEMTAGLKAEILQPVYCKGLPKAEDLKALDTLAETIAQKHKECGLV